MDAEEKLKVWNIKSDCCVMGMFLGSFQFKMLFFKHTASCGDSKGRVCVFIFLLGKGYDIEDTPIF